MLTDFIDNPPHPPNAWTINEPHLPYKTGLDVMQSHPLRRMRFGMYAFTNNSPLSRHTQRMSKKVHCYINIFITLIYTYEYVKVHYRYRLILQILTCWISHQCQPSSFDGFGGWSMSTCGSCCQSLVAGNSPAQCMLPLKAPKAQSVGS